jgi:hypothetical protein
MSTSQPCEIVVSPANSPELVPMTPADAGARPVNAVNCAIYVACVADLVVSANFHMIAACALAAHEAEKGGTLRSMIRTDLAHALREMKARKTKSYDYTELALRIACHPGASQLLQVAASKASVAEAASYLARKFGEFATSVAELARHFGTGIKSRKRGPKLIEAMVAPSRPLLEDVRMLLERHDGEVIPLADVVELLAPKASTAQLVETLRKLVLQPHVPDGALEDLVDLVTRVKTNRARRA